MRKYIILFFSVFPFLFSCNSTPNGIIKPDEMASLLTDIHIADGSVANISQAPDTLYKYATGKYVVVFNAHHTDSTQFKNSFRYYTVHPDELTSIYEQVTKNIETKLDSINALLAKQNTRYPQNHPFLPTAPQPGAIMQGGAPIIQGHQVIPPSVMQRIIFERSKATKDSIIRAIKKRKHAVPEK